MVWPFVKYVGCGNDFIFFDNRKNAFPLSEHSIQSLCNRHYGIGADGVILLELSARADCRMRIFNANGSEAEMCGNGLRCFVKWLSDLGMVHSNYKIEVMHQILQAWLVEKNAVKITMGSPHNLSWNQPFYYQEKEIKVHSLNIGVPHVVLFTEQVDAISVNKFGAFIRHHEKWSPNGTNATFVQKMDGNHLKIRTFERGVEGETLACGTGATAAALAAAHEFYLPSPIKVETASQESLIVDFDFSNGVFSNVTLTGSAYYIFSGEIDFQLCHFK